MTKPAAEREGDGELLEVWALKAEYLKEPVKPREVIPIDWQEDPGFSDGELACGQGELSEGFARGAEGGAPGDAALGIVASVGDALPQGPASTTRPSVASSGPRSSRRSFQSVAGMMAPQWGEDTVEFRQLRKSASSWNRFEACTSFADPTLKRGLHIGKVLKHFGGLLSSNDGSEETFELSKPVSDQLDVFISHNWSTRRLIKFLTLAYQFNFRFAVGSSFLCVVLVGALLATGIIQLDGSGYVGTTRVAWQCSLTSQLVFLLVLVLGHDLRMLFGLKGPMVFLDKACIHQTNPEMQRKGIEGLSAYLAFSDEMLIVYTDVYLGRLWTVYELVSMLLLRPAARIEVIPTRVVYVLFTLQAVYCFNFFAGILESSADSKLEERAPLSFACFGLAAITTGFLVVVLRGWGVEQHRIQERAEAFRIRHAKCAVEADRVTVYKNVQSLMHHLDFITCDADKEHALDVFDMLVSEMVPLELRASCGRSGLPWRCGFCLLPCMLGIMADDFWANPIRLKSFSSFAFGLVDAVAIAPLGIAFISWLCARLPHLKGPANYAYTFVMWLAAMCFFYSEYYFFVWFQSTEEPTVVMWVALAAAGLLTFTLTTITYWPVRVSAEKQESLRQKCKKGIAQLAFETSTRQCEL